MPFLDRRVSLAPSAGNGDVTVMYSGSSPSSAPRGVGWQQWLYLSKNDMWGSDSIDYYPHLSAGRVGILVVPVGANASDVNGTVAMYPGNASIVHTLTAASGGAAVSGTSRVLEHNVVVTSLVCTSASNGTCSMTLLLSDTDANYFNVGQDIGSSPDGTLVWWRKENLHYALNPAYVGSCDPLVPLQ